VYPWTKNTLPLEIFKLVGPSVLAKGFNYAIFDDFSKKPQGGTLVLKKIGPKIGKFFLEIIEERNLHLFLSGSAGVQ